MLLPNPVLEDAVNPSAARMVSDRLCWTVFLPVRELKVKRSLQKLACFCLHRLVQFCRISQIASNLIINRKYFNEKCIISIKWQRKMLFCYRFIQRNSCELQENCTFKGGVGGEKRTGRGGISPLSPILPWSITWKGEKVRKLHFYAKVGAMSFLRFLMFATEVVYSF